MPLRRCLQRLLLLACLAAWGVACAPKPALAHLQSFAPTFRERIYLSKLRLLKDLDDLPDDEAEIMVRVFVHHGGHDVTTWFLIADDINMEGPNENDWLAIDLDQAQGPGRLSTALAFLHDACEPIGYPTVQVDAWEVDIDHIGKFIGTLGSFVGIAGFFYPPLATAGAALHGVGRVVDLLGNDAKHLGSGRHGFAEYSLPPLQLGNTSHQPSENFSYELRYTRETISSAACLFGQERHLATLGVGNQNMLPTERDWLRAVLAAITASHQFGSYLGPAEQYLGSLPLVLNSLSEASREPGPEGYFRYLRLGALPFDYGLFHGSSNDFFLGLEATEQTFRFLKRKEQCWLGPEPEDDLVNTDRMPGSSFAFTTDPSGRMHAVLIERVPGEPHKRRLVIHSRDGNGWSRTVIGEAECSSCPEALVMSGVRLAAAPDGTLHVAWLTLESDGTTTLHHARSNGGDWIVETVESLELGQLVGGPSLAVDSQGRAHLGYSVSASMTGGSGTVRHALRNTGGWALETVGSVLNRPGQSTPTTMSLDSQDRAHFLFVEPKGAGRITPPREDDFNEVGGVGLRAALSYWGPPLPLGEIATLDMNYTGDSTQAPQLAIGQDDEPRVAYAEHHGELSSLFHKQRVAQSVWVTQRVDSSLVNISPVRLLVDDYGVSHIVYGRDGVDFATAGLRTVGMHARQAVAGGGISGPPAPPPVPSDDDTTVCNWRNQLRLEVAGAAREALATELAEAPGSGVHPLTIAAAQADLAAGDSRVAALDFHPAVEFYGTGVLRLLAGNHDQSGAVLGTPPGAVPTSTRIRSVWSGGGGRWVRTVLESPSPQRVRMELYDILGRRLATILDHELGAGSYSFEWLATSQAAGVLPAGSYFVRLTSRAGSDRARFTVVP